VSIVPGTALSVLCSMKKKKNKHKLKNCLKENKVIKTTLDILNVLKEVAIVIRIFMELLLML
jgi:hypothetical protein